MKTKGIQDGLLAAIGVSAVLILPLLLAGCFTVRETPHPEIAIPSLPTGGVLRVQLSGFDATVTSYTPVHGYATVTGFGGPCCHGYYHHCYSGLYSTTVTTTEYIPRTVMTTAFRDRATDLLEHAGCILQTSDPQYRVEVRFAGPFLEPGDGWAAAGWMFLTLLTADYGAQTWTAKLKVHDAKTGHLLFEKDFAERDEAVVWGPIPIFSPMGSDRTSHRVMKGRCLTALTDAAVREALVFLGGRLP